MLPKGKIWVVAHFCNLGNDALCPSSSPAPMRSFLSGNMFTEL